MRQLMNKPLALLIACAALSLSVMSCEKIFGDEDNKGNSSGGTNEEEVIYDIAWEYKVPDGEWIKTVPMFDKDGLYISDTLWVKTTPEGGKVTWSVEAIEGSKPGLDYPVGEFAVINNAIRPVFKSEQIWDEKENTSGKWKIVATVNSGTENEKSVTAEYWHEKTPDKECWTFMHTELESDDLDNMFNKIEMKLGDSLQIFTALFPKGHRGFQYVDAWPWNCNPAWIEEMNDNDICRITIPQQGNKGWIKAIGVGEVRVGEIARTVVVTE